MKKIVLWMDSIVAIFFLSVAAIMYYESSRIYTGDGFAMDPASYPMLIISIILLLALLLLVGGIRNNLRKTPINQASEENDEGSAIVEEVSPNYKNPLKMILLLIAFGFGLGYLGFIVSTLVMIIVGTLMLGYRSYVRMTIGAIVVTLVVYFGFSYLLLVKFPSGLLF